MILYELMSLSEYGEAIALLATFLFIIQMLTPVCTFYRVIRTKTTSDLSVAPYNTAFLSCAVWMLYGYVIKDGYVTHTNLYGAALQLCYVFVFYSYCVNKVNVGKQLLITTGIFILVALYCCIESNHARLLQRMTVLCTVVTLAFFVAPFSNLRHVLRERNAESLPFLLILFTFVVSFLWMLYGIVIDDLALEVTNLVGVVFSSIQLFLIAWFRNPVSKRSISKQPLLGV